MGNAGKRADGTGMVCQCAEKVDTALGMQDHYTRHTTWHQVKCSVICINIIVNVIAYCPYLMCEVLLNNAEEV